MVVKDLLPADNQKREEEEEKKNVLIMISVCLYIARGLITKKS